VCSLQLRQCHAWQSNGMSFALVVLTLSLLLVPPGWPQALLAAALLATIVWQGQVNHRRTDELIHNQHHLMSLSQELRGQQLLIRQQNDNLAAAVDARTAELRDANVRLAEANLELLELDKLRSAVLSNVSHELRTPLTAILGSAQNLRDGLAGSLTDAQRDYVAIIEGDSGRLIRVVNELLDWGRSQSGHIRLQRSTVRLQPLVDEVFMMLRPAADRKGVRLEQAHAASTVDADADKLKQILINLVDNAVKFSRADSTVRLCTEPGEGRLRIAVEDHGSGIAAEDVPHLFERFFRARNGDGTPGSGLGLAIARNLARLHGGDIEVQTAAQRGSTFLVSLPCAAGA
jgi:two-component system cell cycle sensor histidine kinase PleC